MSYEIENPNEFGRLSDKRLVSFEKKIGKSLPADYRQFLLSYNGGTPKSNFFRIEGLDGSAVGSMWGVHSGPDYLQLAVNFETFRNRIPSDLLGFGDDPMGNVLCISLEGENRGSIFFWDHEMESEEGFLPTRDNLHLIATSFSEFLDSLIDLPQDFEDDLERACQTGDVEMLQGLLAKGGDVNRKYEYDRSPMQIASMHGQLGVVKTLIEHGANIERALPLAAKNGHTKLVEYLLKAGADVDEIDNDLLRNTSLIHAATFGYGDVVKTLVAYHADITVKNQRGQTALDTAIRAEHREIIRMLKTAA